MKILLSICYLVRRSGAELFVRDLALSLNAVGHSVVVFAPLMGDMVEELRLRCIACVTDLQSVAAAPDVIIGSTNHETALCLAHFPGIPVISICHDRIAAHGRPPVFSRIRRHVAVDANCFERLVLEHGIPESAVVIIQNGVDLNRFRPRPPLPERPMRAAIFSNYATRSRETKEVAGACAELGILLDVIGEGIGNQSREPATVLPGYDLVFAKARCAMEAMAVGCAVVLLNEGMGMAGMVTPENVAAWHRWNFGRRLLQKPIETGAVRDAISGYSPPAAAAVSQYLRAHGSLERTASAFSRLAETVVAEEATRDAVGAQQENREFARYVLDVLRPGAQGAAREELEQLNDRWALVQRSVSWRITAPLRWVAGLLRGQG